MLVVTQCQVYMSPKEVVVTAHHRFMAILSHFHQKHSGLSVFVAVDQHIHPEVRACSKDCKENKLLQVRL